MFYRRIDVSAMILNSHLFFILRAEGVVSASASNARTRCQRAIDWLRFRG